MQRFLSLSCAALLASVASAQCFESNFGTLIGTGDDTLFSVQPMNITFPMGGVAATYNALQFNTNGVIYLTNGTTAAAGTSTTGYSTSAATMVTNLRGTATGSPRLAAYWRDLNLTAANNAGVFLNNTIPGKCVVTWRNAVHFGQSSPVFTVQAQIFSDGRVSYFYSGTTQNTANTPMVGVSQGALVADPGASDLSVATAGVSTSKIVYQTFATLNTFDLQNTTVSFVPNAGGGYDVAPGACVPAFNQNYGTGCYRTSATFYETFPANTIDLSNSAIRMTPAGSGYAVSAGSPTFYAHTVPGLALTDDSIGTLALPTPFTYPGGTTSSLSICSNGYIWLQTNTVADFSPTAAELFSNPARLLPMWCDGLPDGVTNVNNVFAEVAGTKAYVSWLNVPIFGGVGGTMNVQCEIDLTTNVVEYRYGAVSCGNVSIVGWTPGTGVSLVDVGSTDLSVNAPLGFVTSAQELSPLSLSASPAPVSGVSGTTMTYTTSNIPEAAPGSGIYLGLHIISLGQVPAGLNLSVIGAPGCFAYVATLDLTTALVGATPTLTNTFNVPAGVAAGIEFYAQSAALVVPNSLPNGQNAFGLVTSNGVRSVINGF